MNQGTKDRICAALPSFASDATHRDVEIALLQAGWTQGGAGDWAFALVSPSEDVVARISPFDPVGPYTARLYSEAEGTGRVPKLFLHRRLAGGGDLQVMERLYEVSEGEAKDFLVRLHAEEGELRELAEVVRKVHRSALAELPWCGPLDTNPSNVMRSRDGHLVLIDPYYADGPTLYATADSDPAEVVQRIPEEQRRFMTEIPLSCSGPWPEEAREEMRRKLADAERRPA